MRILLDTCTFLWIVAGDRSLSEKARSLFVDPDNAVYLSSVSAWEIAVKHGIGKLPLPAPPSAFVPEQRTLHRIAELPLSEADVLVLEKLPTPHRDPFDRMLVCQAIQGSLAILTPDPLVQAYPVRCLW